MKKIVINACYGGFSLSPLAVQQVAARKGRNCYFYESADRKTYRRIALDDIDPLRSWRVTMLDIPDAIERGFFQDDNWTAMTQAQRVAYNALWDKHCLDNRNVGRDDPDLVAVVEQLGELANGDHAELKVVKIPDDVEWEIDEYDGFEKVAEKHRAWG